MSTQPKALQLADYLMNGKPTTTRRDAAAELRRLHLHELALAQWLEKTEWVQVDAQPIELGRHRADVIQMRVARLHALNQELLEALKDTRWRIANLLGPHKAQGLDRAAIEKADAAIAKADTAQKVFPKAVADATI